MARKEKLIARLLERSRSYTWDEACSVMKKCGFKKVNLDGSARMFVHLTTKQKVRLHEPHPENTLLPYMVEKLIEGLKNAGELDE